MTTNEPNPAVVADRLNRLEKRVDNEFQYVEKRLAEAVNSFRQELKSIAYVERREYEADRRAMERYNEETRKAALAAAAEADRTAGRSWALAWACLGFLVVVCMAAVAGLIRGIAG